MNEINFLDKVEYIKTKKREIQKIQNLITTVIKSCDYHWDSDIEKKIQEQIYYWCDCYHIDKTQFNIKNDFWRDILTSIFNYHTDEIISKLESISK